MPFFKSGNLESVTIDEASRLPPQERVEKLRQRGIETVNMLTTMLENDVSFTDLKPSNLLLEQSKKEHFVIADEKSFFSLGLANPRKEDGKIILGKFADSVVLSQNYTPDGIGNNSKDFARIACDGLKLSILKPILRIPIYSQNRTS
ncbi:MAG: hypothetical protein AB7F64_00320 [Gammaproteobacteria bacterium]